jgi:septum formation protein
VGLSGEHRPDPLTLASRSPQRRAILEQLGIFFVAVAPQVEESQEGAPPNLVCENALRKARAVDGARVLGVDTAVILEGRAFGKPRDQAEARGFLAALSGRTHEVWSGIALVEGPRERVEAAMTSVTFRRLTESALDAYLATQEWRERAGGYAIQARGAALVERIEGDYLNVVGLPVSELVRMAPDLFGG